MKLLKAMATIAGFTMVSRIAGMVRDMLTASFLGAGPVADAFFVALKLPNFFRRIAGEGAFSVAFVPLYSRILEREGEEAASRFSGRVFSLMFVILSVFCMAMMILMPWVIHAIAPGFDEGTQRYSLAVLLTQFSFPYLLLMSLVSLFGGILNAHHRFGPFAATPILFNLSLIVALLIGSFVAPSVGHAMAIAISLSGILQLAMMIFFLRKSKIRFVFQKPELDEKTRTLFRKMGPGILSAGVFQVNLFADMMIGSLLPAGSISYLYYADRLNQLPLSIAGIAVGTALLPMLSRALAGGDLEESRNLFNRSLEFCFLVALPAAVALLIIPFPLVSTLFEHGEFSRQNALTTSYVLMGYGVGLPAYIAGKVFMTAFWSHGDTTTPVRISILTALLNILLCLMLIGWLGAPGISLATGLVGWLQVYLLHKQLAGKEALRFDDRLRHVFPKIAVCACIMGIVLAALGYGLHSEFDKTLASKLLGTATLIGGGAVTYALAVHLSGILRLQDIRKYLTHRRGVNEQTNSLGNATDEPTSSW